MEAERLRRIAMEYSIREEMHKHPLDREVLETGLETPQDAPEPEPQGWIHRLWKPWR